MTRLFQGLFVLAFGLSFSTQAEIDHAHIKNCDYIYLFTPAAKVEIGFWSNNDPQTSIQLAFGIGGSSEKKTITPVALASGEKAHVIVSKEVRGGSLELIIYEQRQSQGNSRLINPTFKQEFWGDCK